MYDTEKRVALVKKRIAEHRRRQVRRSIPLSCFNIVSIKKSISQRRPRLSRGAAYPSLKLNRTSYMVGGSRKGKCGMFFRVSLCGVLYQGGYAGKEQL